MKVKMVLEAEMEPMDADEMIAEGVDESDAEEGNAIDGEEVAERLVDIFSDKDAVREAFSGSNIFVNIGRVIMTECEIIEH